MKLDILVIKLFCYIISYHGNGQYDLIVFRNLFFMIDCNAHFSSNKLPSVQHVSKFGR